MTTGDGSSPDRRRPWRARAAVALVVGTAMAGGGARRCPAADAPDAVISAPPAPDGAALVGLLLRLGLVDEAALEARRVMFVGGPAAVSPETAFEIGMGLALAGEAQPAAPFLAQAAAGAADAAASDRFSLAGGVALLRAGAIPQALHAFLRVETFGADAGTRRDASRLVCIAQVVARDATAARACVRALAPPGAKPSAETEDALDALEIRPGHRAVIGGALSALLPGLGQATAGAPGDGLLALLVNGGWGTATYLLLARGAYFDGVLVGLGVGLRYYIGNVNNGAEAWRAAAERRREDAGRTLILQLGAGGP
jgi:hypothetical protein